MKNTFIKDKKKLQLEIGDSKQDEFYPQLKSKHWDNECNFSIRLLDDIDGSIYKEKDDKIEWETKDKKRKARFYDIDEDNFEFEVEFLEKPTSNIVEFSINVKRLWFDKQPMKEKKGETIPDNVKGSYAVYHSGKRDGIYKTGKAFHLYRPEVIDADGNRAWCKININFDSEILTIKMPELFLETAIYPVILDPTYGYTSIGASQLYIRLFSSLGNIGTFIRTVNRPSNINIYGKSNASNDVRIQTKYYDINTLNDVYSFNSFIMSSSLGWYQYNTGAISGIEDYNLIWRMTGTKVSGTDHGWYINYDAQEKAGAQNIEEDLYEDIQGWEWSDRKLSAYVTYQDYGAVFINTTGKVTIDGTYKNLSLVETGSFFPYKTNWQEGENIVEVATSREPMFITSRLRDDNYMLIHGRIGSDSFAYTSENGADAPDPFTPDWMQDPPTEFETDYAIFAANVPASESYGMEIKSPSGNNLFTTNNTPLIITAAYALEQLPTYGDGIDTSPENMVPKTLTVNDADNNYFFYGSGNNYSVPICSIGFNEIVRYFSFGGNYSVTYKQGKRVYVCALRKVNSTTIMYKWILKGILVDNATQSATVANPDDVLTLPSEEPACGVGYGSYAYSLGNGVLLEVKIR